MKLQNLNSTREELNHVCVINVNEGCVWMREQPNAIANVVIVGLLQQWLP